METLCQLAHIHHINRVEIRSLENETDYPACLAADRNKLESAKKTFDSHQIGIALIASSFNLTQHGPRDIAALIDSCRVADFLSAPYVRIFGGGSPTEHMSLGLLKQAALLYKAAVTRCREAGIAAMLIVETHGGLITSKLALQLCHEAGEAVPFLWDTHHTWKLGGESPTTTYSKIGSLVRHFHCKDSRSIPSSYGDYAYVLPGHGNFPFTELFTLLRGELLPGCLSLEWEKRWHAELPALDLALKDWTKVASEFR